MRNLSIRKLDENAFELLRIRAASHGLSMEEEVRRIIYQAVAAPDNLPQIFEKHFGNQNGIDIDLTSAQKKFPHEPLDFNE